MIFSKFYQCRHVVLCCVLCLPTLMMEGILCPTPTKHRHIDWRHHIHHVDTDIYIFEENDTIQCNHMYQCQTLTRDGHQTHLRSKVSVIFSNFHHCPCCVSAS